MKQLRVLFFVLLFVSVTMISAAQQDAPDLPLFAAIHDEVLQIYEPATDDYQQVTDVSSYQYGAVWNEDVLAFRVPAADPDPEVFNQVDVYTVRSGETPTQIATVSAAFEFDLAWSIDDEAAILYAASTDDFVSQMQMRMDVYALTPQPGTSSAMLGSFAFGVGCGGGSSLPMDHAYWRETDLNGVRSVFTPTPWGLVHTGLCVGRQATLTDLTTGEARSLTGGDLYGATVAADLRSVAGIEDGGLVVVELDTLTTNRIETSETPDQVAWGIPGEMLYYSARVVTSNLYETLNADELAQIESVMGYLDEEFPIYESRIYEIDLSGAAPAERLVYAVDAFAVGRMQTHLVHNSAGDWQAHGLAFSLVSNGQQWVDAILRGDVTAETLYTASSDAWVSVDLYMLPQDGRTVPADAEAQFIAADMRVFVMQQPARP